MFFYLRFKVLKKVPITNVDDDERSDIEREAKLLSQLDNPHIIKFFDSFVEDGAFFLVTEYCEVCY